MMIFFFFFGAVDAEEKENRFIISLNPNALLSGAVSYEKYFT